MTRPAPRIHLEELEAAGTGFADIASMVAECPVAMAEFGGFYSRAPERLAPLVSPRRRVFLVCACGETADFVDADRVGDTVDITYFTRPRMRRHGIAASALTALTDVLRTERTSTIRAAVDHDNIASQATLRSAGFARTGINAYRELIYEKEVAPRSS